MNNQFAEIMSIQIVNRRGFMEVCRFMSKDEFEKYKKGEVLENNTKHRGFTASEGFCFLDIEDFNPEYAYNFLSGIVSKDVCVVFKTNKELIKSWGQYATPDGDFFDSFTATEYCTFNYSKEDFELLRYCCDFDHKHWSDKKWNWINEKEK